MSRIDIEDLLDRYLDGRASKDEINCVENWLNANGTPGNEWQGMDEAGREKWLSALFMDVQVSAGINQSKIVGMPQRNNLWRYAAAIAAVLTVFFAGLPGVAGHPWYLISQ